VGLSFSTWYAISQNNAQSGFANRCKQCLVMTCTSLFISYTTIMASLTKAI